MLALYAPNCTETVYPVNKDQLAHMRARRLRDGDTVRLMDGLGNWQDAKVSLTTETLCVIQEGFVKKALRKKYIAAAWTRPQAMDTVIEKAVEMGVTDIIPLVTRYVGTKPLKKEIIKRYSRFDALMHAALSQSLAYHLPQLHQPTDIEGLLLHYPDVAWILLDQKGTSPHSVQEKADYGVLVGPEGGWSEEEFRILQLHARFTWAIAGNILRTDTAAIAGMTLMNMMEMIRVENMCS